MAETLGTIASILQLLDVALSASRYIQDFRNATREQQKLSKELGHLAVLVQELQSQYQPFNAHGYYPTTWSSSNRLGTGNIQTLLDDLAQTLKSFMAELQPVSGRWRHQLMWPLYKKREAKEYLHDFERIKLSLNLWISSKLFHLSTQQSEVLRSYNNEQKQTFSDIMHTLDRNSRMQSQQNNEILEVVRASSPALQWDEAEEDPRRRHISNWILETETQSRYSQRVSRHDQHPPTIYPFDSISQAGSPSHSNFSAASYRSNHTDRHYQPQPRYGYYTQPQPKYRYIQPVTNGRTKTYIIPPPPAVLPGGRGQHTSSMIILPGNRTRKAPRIVFYQP
ncbi:hypothetical protein C8F01DRAFT_1162080 [Mycena amicta]|nr:hypothetical protein C8F01DRAFT_1162080 [Mycena amicta]